MEIAEIKSTLKSHRLVVLTGAGGTGKTRLAIRVAGELQDDYRDGVWMVELASLSDPNLVPAAIAQVLKVIPGGEEPVVGSFGTDHVAHEAGWYTDFCHLHEAGFSDDGVFNQDAQLADFWFKLYPWEDIAADEGSHTGRFLAPLLGAGDTRRKSA